jgi:hypothetical protein
VKVDFGARRQLQQVVPFGGAFRELALRVSQQGRAMSTLAQTEHGEQNLALTAAPVTLRVDMERKHD